MESNWPILSVLIWLPILGAVIVLAAGEHRAALARVLALIVAGLTFLLSIPLFTGFDTSTAAMQFTEMKPWIETFHINYSLGVDGFSVPLILLTTFFGVLVVIAGWESITDKVHQYMASFLVMEGLMIGVFSALDALLFYVFFEAMLIPMFLVIGIWGGPNRVYASIKFFLYTFLGSVFMLIGLIYLYIQTGTWSILEWHQFPLAMNVQIWLFLGFLAAFSVKIPMWPVHTWLPDAHVEAPTGGSVILAAIMLKMGGYGFVRLSLPIVPDGSKYFAGMMILLSLIAVVYIGFVALMQKDMKKLIAYSSIAHMGFVTLGFFIIWHMFGESGAVLGVQGGMVQMVSHGLISGALFLCVGVLYDRVHSRKITDYGGVANTMPVFAAFMVLFAMANAGLPGTSGFVGEFMVIIASFKANPWFAFFAAMTLVLGAAYTLWMVKRVVYGEVANDNVAALEDLNIREFIVLAVLALAVLIVGLWPAPLVEMMEVTIQQLVEQAAQSKF